MKLRYLLLLFIIIFAAVYSPMIQGRSPGGSFPESDASLEITSDPPGATIFWDGKALDQKTPCTLTGLTPGAHRLGLRKPNFRDETKTLKLNPGKNSVELSLAETSLYYMWLSLPSLLLGALMTLILTIVAVFNGIVIGTLAGVARVVHNRVLNRIAGIYVDFIRGTPLLVQIFMIHFGTPPILGNLLGHGNPIPINPFVSALLALSINSGAYVAEIVRAGIQSIDKGQMEAARSLGMTYRQAMRHIILPQAMKRVIPPLGNEFIAMLKDSSLVSVIGMEELVRKAQVIVTRSYRPTETWIEVGLLFLAMTIPFTRIVARLERKLKVSD
ncbi:MAG: ABC transporter permease subunit [Firmicutes bacterium]|nr:ABC transporter permease subunit [Bacillota bacterium]